MKDDLKGKSSDQVKQMLMETTVPVINSGQDFESPGYEVGPSEELEEQAEQEQLENTRAYLERRFEEAGGEETYKSNLQSSMLEDFTDLRDKYSGVSNLVDQFAFEFSRGRVKISQEDMADSDAPHESAFLKFIERPSVKKSMTIDDLKEVIGAAAHGVPLRSKAKEYVIPQAMHPRKRWK